MKWSSCAEWAPEVYREGVSKDTHDTKDQALAVCNLLHQEGFGGDRTHFPLKTWVEPMPQTEEEHKTANTYNELEKHVMWLHSCSVKANNSEREYWWSLIEDANKTLRRLDREMKGGTL